MRQDPSPALVLACAGRARCIESPTDDQHRGQGNKGDERVQGLVPGNDEVVAFLPECRGFAVDADAVALRITATPQVYAAKPANAHT